MARSRLALFRGSRNYVVCIRCHRSEDHPTFPLQYTHTARYAVNTLEEIRSMVTTHARLDSLFGATQFKPITNCNVMVFDRNNKLVKWVKE